MLLFLAFGSRSMESQALNKHWRLWRLSGFTGGAPRFLYFSCIWFGFRNSRSGFKARLQGVYLFFFFAHSITFFKKTYQKKRLPLNLHPNRRNLSIDEPKSLYFFLFQKSFNAQVRCTRKCFCTTRKNFYIVVRRDVRSCTCSWGMMYDL